MATTRYIDIKVRTSGAEKEVSTLDNSIKRLGSSSDKLATINTRLTKTSEGVKTGIAGAGRGAGQAGIQFQQFIGQVQGGQSAMLALSQQSADLGIVLGAPLLGAVVGISASLVGILLPALFKTSEATKAFKFNVVEAAEELENLNDLSKAQVSVALSETSKSMDDLAKAAGLAGKGIAAINQKLDAGEKTNVSFTKSGRAIITMTKLTTKETEKLQKELAIEQSNLDKINQEYKKESDLLVTLSKNKDGFSKKTKAQNDEVKSLSISLTAQTIALEKGEEAAFRYTTAQQLNIKAGEQIPAVIDAQISALFRLKKAQEDEATTGAYTEALSFQTEAIQSEILVRDAISKGAISEGEAREISAFNNKIARETQQLNKQLIALGENEAAKAQVIASFNDQQAANVELFQQRLTAAELTESERRIAQADKERTAKADALSSNLSMTGFVLNSLASLSDKNQKRNEKIQRLAIIANTASAVVKSYNNAGGYPLGIPAAIAMGLAGAAQLSKVGGGGGGSISVGGASPSTSNSPAAISAPVNNLSTENTAITQLTNELRNRDPDEPLTVDFTRRIVAAITDKQSSGVV